MLHGPVTPRSKQALLGLGEAWSLEAWFAGIGLQPMLVDGIRKRIGGQAAAPSSSPRDRALSERTFVSSLAGPSGRSALAGMLDEFIVEEIAECVSDRATALSAALERSKQRRAADEERARRERRRREQRRGAAGAAFGGGGGARGAPDEPPAAESIASDH